jgi:hypothetical protein
MCLIGRAGEIFSFFVIVRDKLLFFSIDIGIEHVIQMEAVGILLRADAASDSDSEFHLQSEMPLAQLFWFMRFDWVE